jgi:CRISPR-associated protein Csm4
MQMFRLRPHSAFHFGVHGIDAEQSAEHCPSDTLYAALLITAAHHGEPFFAPAANHDDQQALDPPFLLSSCFPYVGEVPLLPCPRVRLPLSDVEGHSKRVKKLAYVSPTIFAHIVAASGTDDTSLDAYLPTEGQPGKGSLYMQDKVWIAHTDGQVPDAPFWKVETIPHVTVDRLRDSSAYYQVGQVFFAPACGLYVLCQERTTGAAAALYDLLQWLGDRGLGGRRSYGLGQFTVEEPTHLSLPAVAHPQRAVLLSRYRPAPAELTDGVLGEQASYNLIQVSGWLQSDAPQTTAQRRRTVRLLSEGSVIQALPDGRLPVGTVCNVAPVAADRAFPHPVWRYGLALGIGIGA